MDERDAVLRRLADLIASRRPGETLRVAIDGPDAAGKTTLASELVPLVEARGRPVARASVDGFLRPAEERYRLGRDSPEHLWRTRYAAGRRIYYERVGPRGLADVVVENDDPVRPRLVIS